jgi:hypothetical protein
MAITIPMWLPTGWMNELLLQQFFFKQNYATENSTKLQKNECQVLVYRNRSQKIQTKMDVDDNVETPEKY